MVCNQPVTGSSHKFFVSEKWVFCLRFIRAEFIKNPHVAAWLGGLINLLSGWGGTREKKKERSDKKERMDRKPHPERTRSESPHVRDMNDLGGAYDVNTSTHLVKIFVLG